MSVSLIRQNAGRWEKILIYIACGAGGLALFGGLVLLLFGLALGAANIFQTTNGVFSAILLLLAAGYLATGITLARRKSPVAVTGLIVIFGLITLGSLLTISLQGLFYGVGGLYVAYRAVTEASYDLPPNPKSVPRAKLIVIALVASILLSAGVFAATLGPVFPSVLGPSSDTTPTTATPQPTDETRTPATTPSARPTPTYEPPTPDGEFGFTATFETTRAIRYWHVQTISTQSGTDSNGAVKVADDRLQLRAYKCSRVIAERRIGQANGTFTVAFNWTTRAEEWWERPDWSLTTANGTDLNYTVTDGTDIRRPNPSSTRRSHLVATASANTTVIIRFSIHPSQYCHRSNHRNTYLWLDNMTVTD